MGVLTVYIYIYSTLPLYSNEAKTSLIKRENIIKLMHFYTSTRILGNQLKHFRQFFVKKIYKAFETFLHVQDF